LHRIQYFVLYGLHVIHRAHLIESGIIRIRQCQQDMQMFGIGQVVKEGKDACNVQSPACALDGGQSFVADA